MKEKKQILGLNRFEKSDVVTLDAALTEQIVRRQHTQGASSVLFYQQPIEMVSARGVWMFDAAGNSYLDMYNNVPSVGHCHPRVVEAMCRQAGLLNTNTRYLFPVLEQYSEALLATFPAPLTNVIFTCTGSESNDIALRIARMATGKQGIIVTETAYHGNTTAVMEVSPSGHKRPQLPPYVRTVPAPDANTSQPGQPVAQVFADAVQAAIDSLNADGFGCAALLVDTIFSSDGVYAEPAGFLGQAVERVRANGGVFIADEVQPGFGRTGSHYWCFQRHDVVPDIVTLGKPMGNGFPMAGVITRPELLDRFSQQTEYFNTFGGNPVAAATGLSVLQVIQEEALLANADSCGHYLRAGLRSLSKLHPAISDVRGAGLFNAVEFRHPDSQEPDMALARWVINELKEEGILIGAAGAYGNSLKIRPPLCFSTSNANFFIDKFSAVMSRRRQH
ncbi:4-aminobutyrate aminotransferase [Lonsdalea britannica]|uniref:Aspartate aminotransferase family protein n=1 Tax=Lonsdalea britannica TaxID=1082704 RepID=A0AAD0SJC5_9GAMM|nr:aminotransferase class III-fold pyridoxal phosphate-dependent enzyme [Lonsdalea britannica]AXW88390.1 aspartate aminotransferase family protein [Lonsdalea britannica]OSN00655.1 4-aminobutyrate aminotransferase [Lonsdalea britannica]